MATTWSGGRSKTRPPSPFKENLNAFGDAADVARQVLTARRRRGPRMSFKPLALSVPAATVLLRFQLPRSLALCVGDGRWRPCIHQARVDVGEGGIVEIRSFNPLESEARRIVFDQLRRFLTAIAGGRTKLPIENFGAQLFEARAPDRYSYYAIVTGASISATRAVHQPELVA